MKILIFTNNYPGKNTLNNGIFIHRQVKALQQLGAECHVLLLHNWFPPFGLHTLHAYWRLGYEMKHNFFEEYEGVKIHAVPMFVRMPARLFGDKYYDRAAKALVHYIKKDKSLRDATWIYSHFLTDNSYIAARIKDTLNMKLAAIARGDDVHAWPQARPELVANLHYVFEKADLLLANSRNLADDTKKWMKPGIVKSVEVVYNGIEYSEFRPVEWPEEKTALQLKYQLPAGKKYMVCVASPIALKGWIELLEAIKVLGNKFDGWVLLIVAPPRYYDDAIDLEKKGMEMGIADKLFFMGGLTPAALKEVFRASDAFVLPSYNEGMANALLEAMASGLPSIATNVGGHNEVIDNGKNGLMVAPREVQELANAIGLIIANDELRSVMGAKARERMIAFGDYLHNSRGLLELLDKNTR